MKILSNRDLVIELFDCFGFQLPSQVISDRQSKFDAKLQAPDNSICSFVVCLRA